MHFKSKTEFFLFVLIVFILGVLSENNNDFVELEDFGRIELLRSYDIILSGDLKWKEKVFNSEIAQVQNLEILIRNGSLLPTFSSVFFPTSFGFSSHFDGKICIVHKIGKPWNSTTLKEAFQQVSRLQRKVFKTTRPPMVLLLLTSNGSGRGVGNSLILPNWNERNHWHFPIDAGFYVSVEEESTLLEVYSIKYSTMMQRIEVENPYGLFQTGERRSNFKNQGIVAVSMDAPGYELATDFVDKDNDTEPEFAGGFEVLSYRYLQSALNFSEKAMKGTSFIREGRNGTLTGMAEPVNSGEADIGIGATEFLEYRASGPDGITYLVPNFHIGMQAYFKQPSASSIRDVFISAFTTQLWLVLLGVWGLVCLVMYLVYKFLFSSDFFGQRKKSCKDGVMLDEVYIWSVGALCQQGWHITPHFMPSKIIFCVAWFSGFMIYIAFSAQLVSILSVEVVPIQSFEDLLRRSFFIYNDNHIPTTKYFAIGLESRGIIPPSPKKRDVDIEETIGTVLKSPSTMISIDDSFYPILNKMGWSEDFICGSISNVRVGTRSVVMSMFVKRGSSLKGIFNSKILQMNERGANSRILKAYSLLTSVRCERDNHSGNNPLASNDVFTAYLILLTGFALSVGAVFAEHAYIRMENLLKLYKHKLLDSVSQYFDLRLSHNDLYRRSHQY